eukprot:6232944-Amphidinium_carterae.1
MQVAGDVEMVEPVFVSLMATTQTSSKTTAEDGPAKKKRRDKHSVPRGVQLWFLDYKDRLHKTSVVSKLGNLL